MGFLDNVADTIADVATDVKDMAVDAKDTAKLQLEYKTKERVIRSKYESLGRKYYEDHKDDNDNEDIAAINEALARMETIQGEMAAIKGTAQCPSCGAANAKDSVYCCKCGAKLNPAEKVDGEVIEEE